MNCDGCEHKQKVTFGNDFCRLFKIPCNGIEGCFGLKSK